LIGSLSRSGGGGVPAGLLSRSCWPAAPCWVAWASRARARKWDLQMTRTL